MPLDLALLHARVRTLDPDRPTASAVGVQDGRIVVVGGDAEVRAASGPATETVDLGGAAVVPGRSTRTPTRSRVRSTPGAPTSPAPAPSTRSAVAWRRSAPGSPTGDGSSASAWATTSSPPPARAAR